MRSCQCRQSPPVLSRIWAGTTGEYRGLVQPTGRRPRRLSEHLERGRIPIRVVDWVGRVLAIGGALGVVIAIVEAATRQLPLWGAALAIAGCGGSIVVGIGLSTLAAAEFNAMTAPQRCLLSFSRTPWGLLAHTGFGPHKLPDPVGQVSVSARMAYDRAGETVRA